MDTERLENLRAYEVLDTVYELRNNCLLEGKVTFLFDDEARISVPIPKVPLFRLDLKYHHTITMPELMPFLIELLIDAGDWIGFATEWQVTTQCEIIPANVAAEILMQKYSDHCTTREIADGY